ncbi:hypothetical protein BVC80_1601g33 [Macleaya cordata]|uniref:Uncharacterized protein n=1 Tax=Macleaya cordata TaxID=56857 RepID=A0A200QA18_MACCD|nr:hypothetical protein BVC80_1601g33 [Macleaya cordata]
MGRACMMDNMSDAAIENCAVCPVCRGFQKIYREGSPGRGDWGDAHTGRGLLAFGGESDQREKSDFC